MNMKLLEVVTQPAIYQCFNVILDVDVMGQY